LFQDLNNFPIFLGIFDTSQYETKFNTFIVCQSIKLRQRLIIVTVGGAIIDVGGAIVDVGGAIAAVGGAIAAVGGAIIDVGGAYISM